MPHQAATTVSDCNCCPQPVRPRRMRSLGGGDECQLHGNVWVAQWATLTDRGGALERRPRRAAAAAPPVPSTPMPVAWPTEMFLSAAKTHTLRARPQLKFTRVFLTQNLRQKEFGKTGSHTPPTEDRGSPQHGWGRVSTDKRFEKFKTKQESCPSLRNRFAVCLFPPKCETRSQYCSLNAAVTRIYCCPYSGQLVFFILHARIYSKQASAEQSQHTQVKRHGLSHRKTRAHSNIYSFGGPTSWML
jgi:hypothetical protein